MAEPVQADEPQVSVQRDGPKINMVPPCRMVVRATAGARVIGKGGLSIRAIRAAAGANAVRVLQDELPEALKRRQECIILASCGEEASLRQAVSMILDRVFDRSGLPATAERDRDRPYVLDLIVPERAGGGIVGPGGERVRAIIEELGCEVQVSREPLAGIAAQKRVKLLARERGPVEAALWRLQATLAEMADAEVLRPEHFEMREALLDEEEAVASAARERAAAEGRGEIPLRVLLAQGEAATVVGKLGANVARLRDLALVSIDNAEPPFDASERVCSAAKATLGQRLRVLRLVLGDLATRNAAIAVEEGRSSREDDFGPEGSRFVEVRLLFPCDRWVELEPALAETLDGTEVVAQELGQGASFRAIQIRGAEEAVAVAGYRLHRALEPWEPTEAPPREQKWNAAEDEDGAENGEKGKGKSKGKGKGKNEGPPIEYRRQEPPEQRSFQSAPQPFRPAQVPLQSPAVQDSPTQPQALSVPQATQPLAAQVPEHRHHPQADIMTKAVPEQPPSAQTTAHQEVRQEGYSSQGKTSKDTPMILAFPSDSIARYLASAESGVARRAGVKLLAHPSSSAAPATLEISGTADCMAAACYFVQLQLWMQSAFSGNAM